MAAGDGAAQLDRTLLPRRGKALAAGHRPCFYCRRPAAEAFRAVWAAGNGGPPPRASQMDKVLHAFARNWGFRPRVYAPYRARTKGPDERGVGHVKGNGIAGHEFASWAALEGHLVWWMREIADRHVRGTTAETPIVRFERDEAAALAELGRAGTVPPAVRVRRVQADCAIELDSNADSVPITRWRVLAPSRWFSTICRYWRSPEGLRRKNAAATSKRHRTYIISTATSREKTDTSIKIHGTAIQAQNRSRDTIR
jgi:hypothetical protein